MTIWIADDRQNTKCFSARPKFCPMTDTFVGHRCRQPKPGDRAIRRFTAKVAWPKVAWPKLSFLEFYPAAVKVAPLRPVAGRKHQGSRGSLRGKPAIKPYTKPARYTRGTTNAR